jgi:integrase
VGRIYKRGATFWAYWTDVRGEHHRQSLRTGDQAVARARLRELELAATNPAAHSRIALSTAITALLEVVEQENAVGTWRSYAQKARHLVRLFGDIDLRAIDRQRVVGYIQRRKQEGAKAHTIHKELVVLRRTFTESEHRGTWAGDVRKLIPAIKIDYQPRETWLTNHQALQMLERVAEPRRLWVQLAIYAGLCLSEIEGLRWEGVDFVEQKIRVPGKKRASRWRIVPLLPELAYAMESYRKKTGPVVEKWGNVRRDLARACELAKVPRVTPNDLRRTFASWLKNRGADSAAVAALLGHSSTKMVDRVYGKLSHETLLAIVLQLPSPAACTTDVRDTDASESINETSDDVSARRKSRIAK